MQVYTDFLELQEGLRDGTSKECCFTDHDTTAVNVVFESTGDSLSAVQDLFVSHFIQLSPPCVSCKHPLSKPCTFAVSAFQLVDVFCLKCPAVSHT